MKIQMEGIFSSGSVRKGFPLEDLFPGYSFVKQALVPGVAYM